MPYSKGRLKATPTTRTDFLGRIVVALLVCVGVVVGTQGQRARGQAQEPHLDVNDVSFLWPVPTTAADVADLITAEEPTSTGRLWPQAAFDLLLQTAQSTSIATTPDATSRITFGEFANEFAQPSTWKVVGIRIDPSAPGGDESAIARFGSTPQIRVVFQPVTVSGDAIRVHDVTAHLAFSFIIGTTVTEGSPFPKAIPDRALFRDIVTDLKALKAESEQGGVLTGGPLRVHPGLQARVPGLAAKVRDLLKSRLSEERLTELAFMGIDGPEPWIFFAMRRGPDGVFARAHPPVLGGADAQMLTFRSSQHVAPVPTATNLSPRGGVSTASLFSDEVIDLLATPVFPGDARPLHRDIPDVIANPRISNVFNTDCVSCHTESTRRQMLRIPAGDAMFAFPRPDSISGVDADHLPKDGWNVRNFGWFQRNGTIEPTATMRTANEAAESADLVNREYVNAVTPQIFDVK